jgi:phosphatidylglycerophosphate synthase
MSRFRYAVGELAAAQKSAKGVSLYSRYVNRPAGRLLAAAAYGVRMSPNQVTAVSAVLTFTGVALIALLPPSHTLALGVFAALVTGFALDSADGQLARLTRRGSAAGEWLDHVVDCAKMLALHMAVLVSFHRHFGFSDPVYLLIPLAFQFAAVTVFFGGVLTEQLKRNARASGGTGGGAAAAPPAAPSALRSVALLPVDYGLLCAVFLFLGSREVFLVLYCALLAAHLLFLPAFLAKWYRELSAPAR